jgi:ppGpp synthetase/RelA/SpoT-type nucleotidyltranferase
MDKVTLSHADEKLIEKIIDAYKQNEELIRTFQVQLLGALTGDSKLKLNVHSFKYRLKEPDHFRDKLRRKIVKSKEESKSFDISPETFLLKVNDLVGVRILHLYTRQFALIDRHLRDIFEENKYELLEGPFARTWDDESRQFFKSLGISTQDSPSMYTSVHYIVGSASRTVVTAEIQVRTLMEEVWGEVDHLINYPHPTDSVPCREQLKVLARVTSSATRLVDSIFLSAESHQVKPAVRVLQKLRKKPH